MSSPKYECEEIVKEFVKREIVTEELEEKSRVLDSKHWERLASYYEAKAKFDLRKTVNSNLKSLFFDKTKIRSSVDLEQAFFDQKLNQLQHLNAEMEIKGQNEMELFFKMMEELREEFQKIPNEFDNENIHQQIQHYQQSLKLFDQNIANTNQKLLDLRGTMEVRTEDVDILHIKEVTESIQKESLEKYGDSTELQSRLSDIRRNIEFLSKKTQDIKVKYDI